MKAPPRLMSQRIEGTSIGIFVLLLLCPIPSKRGDRIETVSGITVKRYSFIDSLAKELGTPELNRAAPFGVPIDALFEPRVFRFSPEDTSLDSMPHRLVRVCLPASSRRIEDFPQPP